MLPFKCSAHIFTLLSYTEKILDGKSGQKTVAANISILFSFFTLFLLHFSFVSPPPPQSVTQVDVVRGWSSSLGRCAGVVDLLPPLLCFLESAAALVSSSLGGLGVVPWQVEGVLPPLLQEKWLPSSIQP